MTDVELFARYRATRSDEAFRGLVDRYLPLVYAAAVRQVGDRHLAEDVAQAVFLVLIKKAGGLGAGTALAGWLLMTTRYVCRDARKLARRRRIHEQRAAAMVSNSVGEAGDGSANDFANGGGDDGVIARHLDDALATLSDADRAAVALRFFEGRPLKEVGAALAISEPAAQKRVERALAKLRGFFAGRNVVLSVAGLPVALAGHGPGVVPAGLAGTIAAGHVAVSATAMGLAKSAMFKLFWTPAKIVAVTASAVALASAVTVFALAGPGAPTQPAVTVSGTSGPVAATWPKNGEGLPIVDLQVIEPNANFETTVRILGQIQSKIGRHYSQQQVDADMKAIGALGEFARVWTEVASVEDRATHELRGVTLRFHVEGGPQARVLPIFHFETTGEEDFAYEVGQGGAIQLAALVKMQEGERIVDDGKYMYMMRGPTASVGRSASYGWAKAQASKRFEDLDSVAKTPSEKGGKLDRDATLDKVIDGAMAKGYRVTNQQLGPKPLLAWMDDAGRVLSITPSADDPEMVHATYDKPLDQGLFEVPSGNGGVVVIDTDAWLEKNFSLNSAVARKEAHGQTVAIHSVEQGRDGTVLLTVSSRLTGATLRELGGAVPDVGQFVNTPGFYPSSVDPAVNLPYEALLLASARTQTAIVAWYVLIPKRPMEGEINLPLSLISAYSDVTAWVKARGEDQTTTLAFAASAVVPERPRSYLDLADSLFSDAEKMNPVLKSFEVARITMTPGSTTVATEAPSDKYTRAEYLKSLRDYVESLHK